MYVVRRYSVSAAAFGVLTACFAVTSIAVTGAFLSWRSITAFGTIGACADCIAGRGSIAIVCRCRVALLIWTAISLRPWTAWRTALAARVAPAPVRAWIVAAGFRVIAHGDCLDFVASQFNGVGLAINTLAGAVGAIIALATVAPITPVVATITTCFGASVASSVCAAIAAIRAWATSFGSVTTRFATPTSIAGRAAVTVV